jgi:hypothetical protein
MIYVFTQGNIVYDDSTISDAQKAQAVAVESLPEPQTPQGKYAVIRANKATNTVYYEYKDIPKDPEVEQLKQIVADLTEVVLMGGM